MELAGPATSWSAIQALSQLSYSPRRVSLATTLRSSPPRTARLQSPRMTPIVSRGFRGRRRPTTARPTASRPASTSPTTSPSSPLGRRLGPLAEWDFTIVGEVDELSRWTQDEFRALPGEEVTVDIHCVTKWSKLDTAWEGVRVDTLLEGSRPQPSTSSPSATAVTRRTSARGRRRRQSLGGVRLRRRAAGPGARRTRGCSSRTSTSGRAPSGCAGSSSRRRTSRASGDRTATTCTAIRGGNSGTGATDLARRRAVVEVVPETPRVKTIRLDVPVGPATFPGQHLERPADSRGRLPGAAQLLDRVRAGRRSSS